MMRLKDKVAIVTGGGVGIGKAYSIGLAEEGAKVLVADIQEAEAKKVAADIKQAGGEATASVVDVTSPEKTQAMAETALKQYGRIDVLVNNAGLYSALKKKTFMEIEPEEWDRVMAVNLKGLFLCVKAVYPAMQRQGKGKIINISSGTILSGSPLFLHYVSSKAGVIGLTRSLAVEWASRGVRVNAVSPGYTEPTVVSRREGSSELRHRMRDEIPMGRWATATEMVGPVLFLLSEAASYCTGAELVVDGGVTCW
jgi:3-oxoacyl-[acyl-carrier protein] reductase